MTLTTLRVGAVAVCLFGLAGAVVPPGRALAQAEAEAEPAEPSPRGSDVFDDSDRNIGAPKPRRAAPAEPAAEPARPPERRAPGSPARGGAGGAPREVAPAEPEPEAEAEPPPARVALPDKAAQAAALKLVKEVFAEEYKKKSAEDRLALAGQLLGQAADEGNDAATRYVMLREARDIAAAGGDVGTALAAVDEIAAGFEKVDAVALKLEALAAASKKVADAAQAEAVVQGHLAVSADVLAAGDLDRATKVAGQADAIARKAKNPDLTARLNQRKKDLKDLTAQFGAATAAARATLAKAPNDPAANAAMGKFYCLAAGNWERGLPMLAKGNDQAFRTMARNDLAGAAGPPAAMAGLGDVWWDLGEKQSGLAKQHARQRAAHWYELAVEELEGLQRTRVEKRLAMLEPEDGSTTASSPTDKALRLLQNLVSNLPANVRPRKGQTWDTYRVGRWLTQRTRSTPFDAVLKVESISATRYNGRDSISASFERVGPVELDGVNYRMHVNLYVRGEAPPDIVGQFKRGTHVRVRGFVRSMSASSGGGDNGLDIRSVDFYIELARPNLTIVKPPAAAVKAAPDSGKRLLETLARTMPDDLRPVPGAASPDTDGAQAWIDQHALGVAVEIVAELRPVIGGADGAPRPDILSLRTGPVRAAGIDYFLSVTLHANDDDERLAQFRKLKPGSWVRFRGVARQVWQSSWNTDGGRFTAIHFGLTPDDDYTVTTVAAPAGAQR